MRFPRATHLVILVDAHPRHAWLLNAIPKRLRKELAGLEVEVNEEKTRIVDLTTGERFGFLGFDFRRVRSVNGPWRPQYTPKLKKRTALLRKLKAIFGRSRSQPVRGVIQQINPILRGWVNYFRVGHASRCFRDWVEKKVRWHLMRSAKRRGLAGHGGVRLGCMRRWSCSTATTCATRFDSDSRPMRLITLIWNDLVKSACFVRSLHRSAPSSSRPSSRPPATVGPRRRPGHDTPNFEEYARSIGGGRSSDRDG